MRIADLDGRLVVVTADMAVDVQRASEGLFSSDPQAIYSRWHEFRSWAEEFDFSTLWRPFDPASLRTPAPSPPQILAVGLNYSQHAAETGLEEPKEPVVFTKFVSCLNGPYDDVAIREGGTTDWEIELVIVLGGSVENATPAHAWDYVAGLTVGQDLSERTIQFRDPAPQQFNLGKSLPGYGPVGPWLVTPDEFVDRDDLMLTCTVDGEEVQRASTKDMIFSVPQIISRLSSVITLLPGDMIFTGTPAGVGVAMRPPRFLKPGQTLVSRIDGIGELRNRMIRAAPART
ncbi:fumarylacetoacetate hydrolase family protein [Nocardia sp. NPDC052112]|uniref:fumarylacetoacetate hydrolase family protein n=1 Tax=Nocardia sp. NPDC052112 TaxID=3155646 RepID=UPI00343C7337